MSDDLKIIDCTPTWEGILPLYLEAIKNGTPEGYRAAEKELQRMAQTADKYNRLARNPMIDLSNNRK